MMRLAGRNDAGLAKALSVVDDVNGSGVLKVVDAAPVAYNDIKNAINVSQVAKSMRVETLNYNKVFNVAPGGIDTITVTPPAGEMWRITGIQLAIPGPVGAASGTHSVEIGNPYMPDVFARVTFTGIIYVRQHRFEGALLELRPSGVDEVTRLLQKGVATNGMPFTIRYYNNTNVAQTGNLVLWVRVESEPINIGWE